MNTKRILRALLSIMLVLVLVIASGTSSFAASKSKQKTKTTISKSSTLYKTLKNEMFDYEYYKENNPDVVAAVGSSYKKLFNHFIKHGIFEGRQPSEDFNVNAYASAYSDLQAAYSDGSVKAQIINYYTHYVTCGQDEGRGITTVEKAAAAGITVTKIEDNQAVVTSTDGPVSTEATKEKPAVAATPAATPATSGNPYLDDIKSRCSADQVATLVATFCRYTNPNCPTAPHTFVQTAVLQEATATCCKTIQQTCTTCGYVGTQTTHTSTFRTTVEATPEHHGIEKHVCRDCEYIFTDYDYIIHYYGPVTVEEPSAQYPCGRTYRTCLVCGEYYGLINHTESSEWVTTKEPRDGCDGAKARYCKYCNTVTSTMTIDYFGDYVELSPATESERAIVGRACKNCNVKERYYVEANGSYTFCGYGY